MQMIPLKAVARTKEESVAVLRRKGMIPGVVYGNAKNTMVAVEEVPLKKAYVRAGESTLVELSTGDAALPVLFHAIDFDPVSDRMIHVDFYAVDMKKEVEAEVHVRFEGESPAVKDLGAIFVTTLHEVTVRALPADLPHDLAVDIGKLTEFGATITVADIAVPKGVTLLNDPTDVIALVQQPREEEVAEAPAAAAAAGAEGAPAADGAAPAVGVAPAEGAPKTEKKE